MQWTWKTFEALSPLELYQAVRLRSEVFVVEQKCVYLDCDNLDQKAWHLLGYQAGDLVAYLRVLPTNTRFKEVSLGRVITAPSARGSGAGKALMTEALERLTQELGRVPVRISAQAYLEKFYESFGFERVSGEYLEDGIPHIEMLRRP